MLRTTAAAPAVSTIAPARRSSGIGQPIVRLKGPAPAATAYRVQIPTATRLFICTSRARVGQASRASHRWRATKAIATSVVRLAMVPACLAFFTNLTARLANAALVIVSWPRPPGTLWGAFLFLAPPFFAVKCCHVFSPSPSLIPSGRT